MAAPASSAERAAPILRLSGVGRRFGGVVAVSGVDLEVRPGERRAILGPNGAGKTTLFNLISGEFPPTAGTVELFRDDVTALPVRKRGRAMAEAVGLTGKLDVLVSELSHGEQRQLEVGMARAADPQVMMLDEPAAGLSRAERVKLTELLLSLDPGITL